MHIRALKYLSAYLLPLSVALSFTREGWATFLPIFYAFVAIPFVELWIKADPRNLADAQQEMVSKDKLYDWLLYLCVPLQYAFVFWYFTLISGMNLNQVEFWGWSVSLGLMCGVLGINTAHELGHRSSKGEKLMAKLLLMTTLYPHFFIEHNHGHHRNVATDEDPASARYNESLYAFWLRSIYYSYISAWRIENTRTRKKYGKTLLWQNEMIRFTVIELIILVIIPVIWGFTALLGFGVAALGGILLLETVNYIEHYGLRRKKVTEQRYENTRPMHSWNSNHIIGRLMLFELSRHSDHHAYPHRKYQILENHGDSPQLPTGYPGMMLLATIPPLWFRVMNPKVKEQFT
ncbi:MAG: alkane 1-monooxygenase [Owenweeksia sp.]